MKFSNLILNMFGQSPIHPLQQHMAKVYACTEALIPFFESVYKEDWEKAYQQQRTIAGLEEDADQLKTELALNLPSNLFTAIPRSDLLQMLYLQDKIANKAKDIAGLVFGRHMQLPKDIVGDFKLYLKRCVEAAEKAHQGVNELDELLASGFGGTEVELIKKMIIELDKIENDTDAQQVTIRKKMQALERTWPPVDIIFLYKIIEWTGDLADYAHDAGAQLQIMTTR